MAENQKGDIGNLNRLALIADGLQNLYKGKSTVIFELKSDEYKKSQKMLENINSGGFEESHKQFKIEISGTDFIYMLIEDDK